MNSVLATRPVCVESLTNELHITYEGEQGQVYEQYLRKGKDLSEMIQNS